MFIYTLDFQMRCLGALTPAAMIREFTINALQISCVHCFKARSCETRENGFKYKSSRISFRISFFALHSSRKVKLVPRCLHPMWLEDTHL